MHAPAAAPPVPPLAARFAVMPDGRRLAYAEYGDPSGFPVLYHHGLPGSRLEGVALDDAARAVGAWLIAPDRPGMGESSFQPRRVVLDWPRDAAVLADQLGVERFAALGWSGGGPYALACAHGLGDRVSRVALVAAMAPMDREPARSENDPLDRVLFALARRAPILARATLAAIMAVARRRPALARRGLERDLPAADRVTLAALPQPIRDVRFFTEAARHGARGAVLDYRLLGAGWGFELEAVDACVDVWQGDADTVVPLRQGEEIAARVPGARLHRCPGDGHLVIASRAREILAAAVAPP